MRLFGQTNFPAAGRPAALVFFCAGIFTGCAPLPLEQPGGFLPLDPETLFAGSRGPAISRQSGEMSVSSAEDQSLRAAAPGQIKGQALEPGKTQDNSQGKSQAPKPPAPEPAAQTSQKLPAMIFGEVSGTGRLLHSWPLSGLYSKEYYLIRGRLPASGSWIRLDSHFTGFRLEDGIQTGFLREGAGLKIQVSSPGYPKRVIYKNEAYFLQTSEIDLRLSVQNGSYDLVRVQVWDNYINRSGFLKAKAKGLGSESRLADTLAKGLAFYSFGRGARWGVRLNRAKLMRAARISPRKFPDGQGMEAIWSLE